MSKSGVYGYIREAVRVKVRKCEHALNPEYRKFSIDPQITSFEVLQSIIAKAFDIKGEFTVSYRALDDYAQEALLPLLSDWDLDAAVSRLSGQLKDQVLEKIVTGVKISPTRTCRVCSSKGKNSETRYICKTCSVPLQVGDCYAASHTKKLLKVI